MKQESQPSTKQKKNKARYLRLKRRMSEDPIFAEKIRNRWKLKKRKQRSRRGEEINERQRESYKRNRQKRLESIIAARRKRNPTIGLTAFDNDLRTGKISLREYVDKYRAAIEQCRSLIDREA